MKSERQLRAEDLAARFRIDGRRPVVLEFAGVPKAGKTSTIGHVQGFLKRCGFRVETVPERAAVCPIRDKKHSNFNIWTTCSTLALLLEKTQTPPREDDPDILILDRGLFDAVCWLTMMERLSRLRLEDLKVLKAFLRIQDWRDRISAVFVMLADPEDSLSREGGHLAVEAQGSIMNAEVLRQTASTTRQLVEELKGDFPVHVIDTSALREPVRVTETVADLVLDTIEQQLEERVLTAPAPVIRGLFAARTCIDAETAIKVVRVFEKSGTFVQRASAERDEALVQALPAVVVRNKSGDVLLLRRREADSANPLHNKLVIWAGGHVRLEDGFNGGAVVHGALRELQEELRLSVEAGELRPIGGVYLQQGERASKHVAVVYEWQADTDDVAIALSDAEFYERRGNSLSGRFVSVDSLVEDVTKKKLVEPWSVEILRVLIAPDRFDARLF